MTTTDQPPIRVGINADERKAVRVLAAKSNIPMTQWYAKVIREAIEDERVFKREKE